jgi:hypothetical protein
LANNTAIFAFVNINTGNIAAYFELIFYNAIFIQKQDRKLL